ncbi:MAG: hypothetical protein U0353_08215 [Sandaracinus sp.]
MSSLVCQVVFLAVLSTAGAFAAYWFYRTLATTSVSAVARFASERGWGSRPGEGWVFRYEGELDGVRWTIGRQISPRTPYGKTALRPIFEVSTSLEAPGCLAIEPTAPIRRALAPVAARYGVTRPSRVALLTHLPDAATATREGFEVRTTPSDHPLAVRALEVAAILGAHRSRTLRAMTVLVLEDEMVLVSTDPLAALDEVLELASRCRRALGGA